MSTPIENNTAGLEEILRTVNELPNADDTPSDAVRYTQQTLTPEQQAQARENIGITGTGANGSDGKDGTSVTVKSVSESTADGGSNVVTFSDGKTLTVKNGGKGSTGDKGDKGDTGPQGPAYTLTSTDKTTIVNAVKAALPTLTVTGIDADGVSHSWTVYGVAL